MSLQDSSLKAFKEVVSSLARDMPLMMHGSGDVVPSEVNPDSVKLLSELTALYISNLVDAALDAHNLLTEASPNIDTRLPPPPFRHPRNPLPPRPPDEPRQKKEKRRRPNEEYWDDPLPAPKIKKKSEEETTTTLSTYNQGGGRNKKKFLHVDEWVGVAGVDLRETSRSRALHVRMPNSIGAQSFIFPICHDAVLYGRVRTLFLGNNGEKSVRDKIAPILVDPVIMELIRTEGPRHYHRRLTSKTANKSNSTSNNNTNSNNNNNADSTAGGASDDDDVDEENPQQQEEEEVEEGDVTWPGIDQLLPIYRTDGLFVDDIDFNDAENK